MVFEIDWNPNFHKYTTGVPFLVYIHNPGVAERGGGVPVLQVI